MARPKTTNPKINLSITINSELDDILNKICEEKNINKSKYIEHLIKKDMKNRELEDLKGAIEEVRLYQEGKITLKSARDLLDEL